MLSLANGKLRVDVLPEMGGRIWNLVDLSREVQWIWHHQTIQPQKLPLGTSYDDHWAGGWEELFPNDAAGSFDGRDLPDHGEWWTQSWDSELREASNQTELHLRSQGRVTPARLEKIITLPGHSKSVSVRYRIANEGSSRLRFLFKQHLPVKITARHRLEVPAGTVTPVDLGFSGRIGGQGPFRWPRATGKKGETVDLSSFPAPEEKQREFIYLRDVTEGWCGVLDQDSGARLRMHYPIGVFRFLWFFMAFGGWRDIYTVVLEPCTNMPKDLATADRLGQCASLAPGEVLDCEVRVELS